jgi:hypothetical protein
MVNSRFKSRYEGRYARLPRLSEREVCRPHLRRRNPIYAGKLEFLVQPVYDFMGTAVATASVRQILFTLPIGQSYTPTGGAAVTKTLFHTNLVQAGILDAPKKLLVKAVAVVLRPDTHGTDLALFIGQGMVQLRVSDKDYWTSLISKAPAGAGGFSGSFGTLTAPTSLQVTANGWPSAENVATITDPYPQVPGLEPMEPILGVLIEQQQNFQIIIDPTLATGTGFTTQAAAGTPAGTVGNAINAHVYLEGVLMRAIL